MPPGRRARRRWLVGLAAALLALPGAATAAGDGKVYVALGDSYSAGPGLAPTREPGCSRSAANYASLLAAALHLGTERRDGWADYSCSGATARRDASAVSVPEQIGWARDDGALGPATRMVTFTAGGNDGWAGRRHDALYAVLAACVRAGSPCGPQRRVGPVGRLLSEELTGLLPSGVASVVDGLLADGDERGRWTLPEDLTTARMLRLVRPLVAELRRAAPSATIAVVGYPSIVPSDGRGCAGPLGLGWSLEPDETRYLDRLLTAYDRAERTAVAALDRERPPVRYVDLRTPSRGHDLCAGGASWISPPILAGLGFGGESLHPTAAGMERFAAVVGELRRAVAPPGRPVGRRARDDPRAARRALRRDRRTACRRASKGTRRCRARG